MVLVTVNVEVVVEVVEVDSEVVIIWEAAAAVEVAEVLDLTAPQTTCWFDLPVSNYTATT